MFRSRVSESSLARATSRESATPFASCSSASRSAILASMVSSSPSVLWSREVSPLSRVNLVCLFKSLSSTSCALENAIPVPDNSCCTSLSSPLCPCPSPIVASGRGWVTQKVASKSSLDIIPKSSFSRSSYSTFRFNALGLCSPDTRFFRIPFSNTERDILWLSKSRQMLYLTPST